MPARLSDSQFWGQNSNYRPLPQQTKEGKVTAIQRLVLFGDRFLGNPPVLSENDVAA